MLNKKYIINKIKLRSSPPTGLSLGTPPVKRPPTGGAEPEGLTAPQPLVPPDAPPPLGSKNQNHRTVERELHPLWRDVTALH